jgi:nucleoid-associated protein YgaU
MDSFMKYLLKRLKANESTMSMILGAVVVIAAVALLFNNFKPERLAQIGDSANDELVLADNNGEQDEALRLPALHLVSAGEHLWALAERYYGSGYNWVDIAEANGLRDGGQIEIGQELRIPNVSARTPDGVVKKVGPVAQVVEVKAEIGGGDTHTVVQGDTLWNIAQRAYDDGFMWTRIYHANSDALTNPDIIEVGQVLRIPR